MNQLIHINDTIIDALKVLNQDPILLTAFVLDDDERLVGSITDGDIRRYLIAGGALSDAISNALHRDCVKVKENDSLLLEKLKKYREARTYAVPCVDSDEKIVKIFDLKAAKSYLPIDVVLMAGGKGERLRPLTEKTPKPLVEVGDKCIIDYNIDRLIEYGVQHINVTVNYLKEQFYQHFDDPRNGIKVDVVEEPKFLGTIGSVKFVKKFYNDTILVMNSDLFTNIDFEDFYLHYKEYDADMSVAAIPYNVSIPFGILDLDGRKIKGLFEKPKYNYYANGGIYLIKKSLISEIPEDTFFNATDLIEKLIAENKNVIRYPLNGTWIDIGQHSDLEKARTLVKHLN